MWIAFHYLIVAIKLTIATAIRSGKSATGWCCRAGHARIFAWRRLLLKLGHAENHCLEVDLEVEGGFRGVGPLSAEARFWLPGSFGWASD